MTNSFLEVVTTEAKGQGSAREPDLLPIAVVDVEPARHVYLVHILPHLPAHADPKTELLAG